HADIYPDVAAIQWQFHQLLRMVPRRGLVVSNAADANLEQVIGQGCWSAVERFSSTSGSAGWWVQAAPGADYSSFAVMQGERRMGEVHWSLMGRHNAENALAAMLAARDAGVDIAT